MAAVAAPPSKKTRCRREPWLGRGVRRCEASPNLFQLRIHVGPLKSDGINFGLYASDAEARRVRKLVVRMWRPPTSIWSVLKALKESGDVPQGVLPRWVYRRPDGMYGAKVSHGPRRTRLDGPFESEEEAHDAMRKHLGLPPLGPRRVK